MNAYQTENVKGRLAIIEIKCPLCDETTRATLPDNPYERDAEPEIDCEACGGVFKFTDGLLYRPIGYAN